MFQTHQSFSQTNDFYQQALVFADRKQFYRSALCLKDAIFSAMNVYKGASHLSTNDQNLEILTPSQILLIQKLNTEEFQFENQLQFERFFEQCMIIIETVRKEHQVHNKINFFNKKSIVSILKNHQIFWISISVVLMVLILSFGGLHQWYQANRIYQDSTLESQLFWVSKKQTSFSESQSYGISLKSSHLPQDYAIQFPQTITANQIRFDPARTALDEVRIYSIQLFLSGQFVKEIPFHQIENYSFINIDSYTHQDGYLSLQFDNHDPYFITHQFDEISFNQVKMRLSSINYYPFVLTFMHLVLQLI